MPAAGVVRKRKSFTDDGPTVDLDGNNICLQEGKKKLEPRTESLQ